MSNALDRIFKDNAFWRVDKYMARIIGIDATILFTDLYNKQYYFENNNLLDEDGFFFNTSETIEEDTTLSYYKQRKALDILTNFNLIEMDNKTVGNKTRFKILKNQLLSFFNSGNEEIQKLEVKKIKFSINKNKENKNKSIRINNNYSEKKFSDFSDNDPFEKNSSSSEPLNENIQVEVKKEKSNSEYIAPPAFKNPPDLPIKAQKDKGGRKVLKTKESEKSGLFSAFNDVFFLELHPEWSHNGKVDGLKMKSIIKKMKKRVDVKNENATNDDYLNAWKMMLSNLPEFYKTANLSIIDSHFDSIIDQIIRSNPKNINQTQAYKVEEVNKKTENYFDNLFDELGIDKDWNK